MDLAEKLSILAGAAKYDASCASSGSDRSSTDRSASTVKKGLGATVPSGVCHSWTGDGRCVSLLKVLYSNVCRLDCAYCLNRVSNDIQRASFSTEELVRLTIAFYKRNYIEGLFLSSGVFSDPDIVMARLVDCARRLRRDQGFQGYIHLKAIPGCGEKLMREAALWADRLSANIELPTETSLRALAPQKEGKVILNSMRFLRDGKEEADADSSKPGFSGKKSALPFLPAGQSTQLIIGATEDTDSSILKLSSALYGKMRLKRVYYSAYIPVSTDKRLPDIAAPLAREHRLYQADWLIRLYRFSIDELLDPRQENLDADIDPKLAWALRHPECFPIDIQKADFENILRVPGIGIIGARRILESRRARLLRWEDLPKLGISLKRAGYFISLVGKADPKTPNDPAILRALLADSPKGEFSGQGEKKIQGINKAPRLKAEAFQSQLQFAF